MIDGVAKSDLKRYDYETKCGYQTMSLSSSEALNLWRLATTEGVRRDAPDLSARQMALLLIVYMTDAPHTVRGLSDSLSISKPAVTRALDRLGKLELLRRKTDEDDRRSVLVQRTVKGSIFLREYGEIIATAANDSDIA